jgi:hypothetical protein
VYYSCASSGLMRERDRFVHVVVRLFATVVHWCYLGFV